MHGTSSAVVPAAPAALAEAYAEHTVSLVFDNRDDAFSQNFPFVVTSPGFTALREWKVTVRTAEGRWTDGIEIRLDTETYRCANSSVTLSLYGGKVSDMSTSVHTYFVRRTTLEAHREWTEMGKFVFTVGVHERDFKGSPRVVHTTSSQL